MAFSIEPSPEIWHRCDMPILANWRKLWRMAEVGVDRGDFAQMFLSRWQGTEYYGVDDYRPYPEMNYDREADYLMAVQHIAPHAARAKLIRERSIDAAGLFQDGYFDFVYLDGAHTYKDVNDDLRAWWPKISERGMLAGHDFDDQEIHQGVKQAVTEFAQQINQTIYLTAVPGYGQEPEPSWYLYKSGMPGADWRRC